MNELGRRMFGFAAVFLGAAELVHGDFATTWEPVPDAMPARAAAALLTALLLTASGLGLQWRRTVRPSAAVIAFLYFLFTCLWLRRVIGYPEIFGTWGGTAEELVPLLAAIAITLDHGFEERQVKLGLLRSCCLLYGICVIAFGVNHFFAMSFTASLVPSWIPPSQWTWALLTGIFDVLGGLAIIAGFLAVPAARLLTLMYLGFALLIWIPRMFTDPSTVNTWMGNGVNFSIIGAAWVFADLIKSREAELASGFRWIAQRRAVHAPA